MKLQIKLLAKHTSNHGEELLQKYNRRLQKIEDFLLTKNLTIKDCQKVTIKDSNKTVVIN